MLFAGSRYADTRPVEPIAGRPRSLELRRIPPAPGVITHVVMEHERLDQLASRFFGDPHKAWLILDANLDELHPLALLVPGRRISIPFDRAARP
jgi:hypothetical protein